jgi:predicted AlkP superfamily pyrophosphatase or phosphodiesterase
VLKKTLNSVVTAVLVLLLLSSIAFSGETISFPRRPKLVLILVIDQFRYDYLVRFRQQFVQGGFNVLLDGGANFVDCRYNYATTATGPGHATLLTGAYPSAHGIISNEWYDSSHRRPVYCVEDQSTKLVDGADRATGTPGYSPHYLFGSTLGDELRAATDFHSKVLAISLKDRAAILMGGHSPSAAYWYDPRAGRFVSSTYYMPALPSWVVQFNEKEPAKAYCGRKWAALVETPGAGGQVLSEFGGAPGESCPDSKFLGWLDSTPFMTEMELDFAEEAIRNEHLGQGTDTDLLAVSLSVNDYIGHAFGPYSPQIADNVLQTDRYLAAFLGDLDKLVGLDNVWIALTADHGVAPNPEFIQNHKLGPGNAQMASVRTAVEKAMVSVFGPGAWVEGVDENYVYLSHEALSEHQLQPSQAEEVAAQAAASAPGVWEAFTRAQLLTGKLPMTPIARAVSNSFNPKRGGDIFVVLEPYAVPVSGSRGTTHGSPWNYDSQVPLLLWGKAFKPGVYFTPCEPIDLAATLAAALGLSQPSGAQGKPLVPAMKP